MSVHGPRGLKIWYPRSRTTQKQVSLAKFLGLAHTESDRPARLVNYRTLL